MLLQKMPPGRAPQHKEVLVNEGQASQEPIGVLVTDVEFQTPFSILDQVINN